MRRDVAWVFNIGAEFYRWFTSQAHWQSSCRELAESLPNDPGLRLVDLGCGPGSSTRALSRARPDALVIGLDRAWRMVRLARADGPCGGSRTVAWTCADAGRLPFQHGTVDVVTGHSVLYLLPDRAAALAESRRVLRPGGYLVLMEPRVGRVPLRELLRSGEPRHVLSACLWRLFSGLHGRFTPRTIAAMLDRAGFVDFQARMVLDGLGLLVRARKPL